MSSLWTENIEMPEFPTLEKDIRTQVLIIGGGKAGVSESDLTFYTVGLDTP